MNHASIRLALSLCALAGAGAAQAQAVSLVHVASVYEDDKERPLKEPEGVACDAKGKVVVADTANGRLLTLTWQNRRAAAVQELRLPQLTAPAQLQLDAKGSLLVLDRRQRKIGRVDAEGKFQGFVEPRGESGVVVGAFRADEAGNLLVLDLAAVQVLWLDAQGNVTRKVALPRGGAHFTDVAVDPAGTAYAVDAVGSAIWSADRSATAWKPLVSGMKESMSFPTRLAVSRGRLFVTDQHGQGLAVFGIDGSFQGRLLGMGWSDGLVYYPQQVCITEGDDLFLADRYNGRMQAFSLTVK